MTLGKVVRAHYVVNKQVRGPCWSDRPYPTMSLEIFPCDQFTDGAFEVRIFRLQKAKRCRLEELVARPVFFDHA